MPLARAVGLCAQLPLPTRQCHWGRVFYTSLGHRDDVWDPTAPEGGKRENAPELSKLYQQHVLGGILWSLGLAPGDAKPQGVAK
jgi:type 1 glutamine amidotransferase